MIESLEHTFIISNKLLHNISEAQELNIDDHYTHNLGEKFSNLLRYKMPVSKKLNRLIPNAIQVNQWIICKK